MKIPIFLFSACLAASLWAEDAPETEEKPAGFQIVAMKCFSDKIINKAEAGKDGIKIEGGVKVGSIPGPGSELSDFAFPEDQRKQYFEFQFGPGSEGKEITANVQALKTTLGANVPVVKVSGKTDKEGKLPAEWNMKKNWPVGLYKVYFTYDGKPIGTAGYLVKALKDREAPIKSTGVIILSLDKEGNPTEKKTLTPKDNDLAFKCATTGADTKGANVDMFLTVVNDKGEKQQIQNSQAKVDDWPLENTEIIYSFSRPDDMPVGEYELVVNVDDQPVVTHPFKVAE